MQSGTANFKDLGAVVSGLRQEREWKQLALASEANISERTVQRLERGEPVNEDTLRKVAAAFKFPEDAFLRVLGKPIPDIEWLRNVEEKWRKEYAVVELKGFHDIHDVNSVLQSHVWKVDKNETADSAADFLAEFEDSFQDWIHCYDECSATTRLKAARELLGLIRRIEECGCMARYAALSTVEGWRVALVAFFPEGNYRYTVMPRQIDLWLAGKFLPSDDLPSASTGRRPGVGASVEGANK